MSSSFFSFDLQEVFSATIKLFIIIDVLPCIPLIIYIKNKGAAISPSRTAFAGLCIMTSFYLAGGRVLSTLGIREEAFAAVGAFIICCYGIELLMGQTLFKSDFKSLSGAAIVPMAFPLTTGVGTLVMLLQLKKVYTPVAMVVAMLLNVGVIYAVLRYVEKIERLLGQTGQLVVRSLTGVALLAMGMQGFGKFFGVLT